MTATASALADRRRTLTIPFTAASCRGYLYFLLVSVFAVVGVVYLFVTGLTSGLLLVTLIGIPLLALVVLSVDGGTRCTGRWPGWSASGSTPRPPLPGRPAGPTLWPPR
ncbi:hypothetical protein [Mycolicibacterium fortuitum]|uniref:hypothetical protein n=1 Tax=Mycolicibacterium fortuitum TaxID=1766 RepID=UPI001F306417|nr:hypothetical protein [Mycolicibacterium fortuitum]